MTTVARRDPADKAKVDAIEKKLLANPDIAKLIDDLGTSTTDANDLVRGMLQASITRGLNAEMDAHLGYESGDRSGKVAAGTDNYRNGSYPKTVDSNYGPVTVDVPRDRAGTFLPTMVPKGSRRLTDVDDMIISLYAGGMTIRDIQHGPDPHFHSLAREKKQNQNSLSILVEIQKTMPQAKKERKE